MQSWQVYLDVTQHSLRRAAPNPPRKTEPLNGGSVIGVIAVKVSLSFVNLRSGNNGYSDEVIIDSFVYLT